MSIRNLIDPISIPTDLAKRLGPKNISMLLELMWLSYYELHKAGTIDGTLDENEITSEWYLILVRKWQKQNVSLKININIEPITQYPDKTLALPKGAKPTIDFCFRAWDRDDGYFGAECKILLPKNESKYKRYIKTGVNHFVTGRYGSKSSESAMIGYALNASITEIETSLKKILSMDSPTENLHRDWSRSPYPHFLSQHTRSMDDSSITLHHLFFEFSV